MTPRVAIVCAFVLLLPATLLDRQSDGTRDVTGVVYFSSNSAGLSDALVQLCDSAGRPILQTFTNPSGNFEFRALDPRVYLLTFTATGYDTVQTQVDLSVGSRKNVSVMLSRALPSEDARSSGTVSTHELSMPARAREFMVAGKRALNDKNTRAALEDFRRAADEAPGYYEACYEMGVAFVVLGQRSNAVRSFHKALEMSSDKFGDADVALGTLQMEDGNVEDAERFLRRGVSLNQDLWLGYFELGKLELERGHLDQGLAMAERAQSLSPKTPIVYRLLANVHLKQGDSAAFLKDIDSYLKLDPDSPAGIRAKELREEVQRQLARKKPSAGHVPEPSPNQ